MFPSSPDPDVISWSYLLQFAVFVPLAVVALRAPGERWHQAIDLKWVPVKVIAIWTGIWLLCWMFAVLLYWQLSVPVNPLLLTVSSTRHWGLILLSILLAPLLEEIIFRACGFRLWRHTRLGLYGTLLLTSLLFTLIHLGHYTGMMLALMFALGILLGLARENSGSLLVPLLLHTLNNLFTTILIL